MVVNKVFEDPRGVNCVYCYTDTAIPLDSIITFDGVSARISKVFTAEEGWNPGPGNSNQGVIGFNYTGQNYTYGDTFNVTNGSFTLPVSSYAPVSYGYLNFTSQDPNFYPGNYLNLSGTYIDVGYNDFTIECFFKQNIAGEVAFLFQIGQGESFFNGLFSILIYAGEISYVAGGSPTSLGLSPSPNEWHHVALVRYNGSFYVLLDGVFGSFSINGSSFNLTSQASSINLGGSNLFGTNGLNEVYCLNGSISNFRVTKNVALYTEIFDPSSLVIPLVADANTSVLLLPTSEPLKYTNSVDNSTFTCRNNPVTNEPVTFSAGPIAYPPPPEVWYVSWSPNSEPINWCYGYTSGECDYSVSIENFNFVDFNNVKSFNISNIDSLSGLDFLPNLEAISIGFLTATSFDLTNNITSLTSVSLNGQYLTSINGLSTSTPLRDLSIQNSQLNYFNGAGLTNLIILNLYQNTLSSVDVSQNVNLEYLNIAGQNMGNISSVTLTANSALTELIINNNQYITELNISQNVLLEVINGYNCNFSSNGIDISNNPLLRFVSLSNCNMSSSQVDNIINTLGSFSVSDGILELDGNGARTSASNTGYNTLLSRNWTIIL